MAELTSIRFLYSELGDWVGLYLNGKRVRQGHTLSGLHVAGAIAECVGIEVVETTKSLDWLAQFGWKCPPSEEQID